MNIISLEKKHTLPLDDAFAFKKARTEEPYDETLESLPFPIDYQALKHVIKVFKENKETYLRIAKPLKDMGQMTIIPKLNARGFRCEIHPDDKFVIRILSNFAHGSFKACSLHYDVIAKKKIVKMKMILNDSAGALNFYKMGKYSSLSTVNTAAFYKEASLMQFLGSEHGAALLGFNSYVKKDRNGIFIHKAALFSEFMSEGTLSDYISKGASQEIKHGLMRDYAEAVLRLHSKNIIHFDLKPTNLYVTNEHGKIRGKIGDLNLSQPVPEIKGFGGTEFWMAHDMIQNCERVPYLKKYAKKSDAFSLGLSFFALQRGITESDFYQLHQAYYEKNPASPLFSLASMPREALFEKKSPDGPYETLIYNLLDPNPETRASVEDALKTLQS